MLADKLIKPSGFAADLVRDLDWSSTPLGPIESWTKVLLNSVNMILAAPIPMQLFWGPDFICIYNDAMVPALSNKHPGSFGKSARDVWSEAWTAIGPQMEHVATTGASVSFGNALVPLLRNGVLEDRYWTYSYSPVFDASGKVVGVLDVAQDTTETIAAEGEIRSGRLRLMLALEAASLASWFYDPVRNVVGGDALMAGFFGLSVPEGPAEIWLAAIVEEDRERVGREFVAAIQGAPYDTEYRVCVEGKLRWIRARAKIVQESETLKPLIGICEDITERKRAVANLHETVERLALAQQVGNIATWEWDLQTGLFTWDEAGAWVYGRPPSELTRIEALQSFIHKDDLFQVMERIAPVLAGIGEFNTEFRVCWPDGTNHWLIGKARPIKNEDGVVIRLNGVNIDITDRRTAELALRQSEKLAAVGQLASTISHEINNPLESVTNLLYLSKLAATDDPVLTSYLSTAEVELRRVSAITSQTLRFHKQQTKPTEIAAEDLFTNALLIFQGRIENAGIRVEKSKRTSKPITCLEGEIRQVVNNLIGNAIDAMKQGGRLIVRSAESTDWATGRKGLRLTVADTGAGMSKKTLSHLFQAFYTTKGIGGTGLGLWVSQEIVQRHKGRLSVRSCDRPGDSGTVFTLFLPFQSDVRAAEAAPAPSKG